jgi:prevent-host-death family protein
MRKRSAHRPFGYPLAGRGPSFSVREAKAHFSALLERAAGGEEITITWHGRARARILPVPVRSKPFHVDRAWLNSIPMRKNATPAEVLVRADRDARG